MRGGLGGCLFYEYEGMEGHELWEGRMGGVGIYPLLLIMK
jgi:hypothetical protein